MKRMLPLLALSSSFALVLSAQTAMAGTTSNTSEKAIYLNGKAVSHPVGFVENNTTYIPIWYVANALKQAGISNTWSNGVMNFKVSRVVNVTKATNSSGKNKIAINNEVVESFDGIVRKDPASNKDTEYVPIWYIMQALKGMDVVSKWDGTNWHMTVSEPSNVASSQSQNKGSTTSSSASNVSITVSSTPGQSKGSTTSSSASNVSITATPSSNVSITSSPTTSNASSGSSGSEPTSTASTTASTSGSTSATKSPPSPADVSDVVAAILGTSSYSQLPTLQQGSTGVFVSALQTMLKQLGYSVRVTGTFDDTTNAQFKKFQTDHSLTDNGIVSSSMWKAIQQAVMNKPAQQPTTSTTPNPPVNVDDLVASIMGTSDYTQLPRLASGSTGVYVSAVQSILKQLNYPIQQTGNFNVSTLAEVKQFEADHSLSEDGVVTPAVWKALQTALMNQPAPFQQISTVVPPIQPISTGFPNVDLRFPAPSNINTTSINAYLQKHDAPMTGLGNTFMQAQSIYGVDANYLVSHAILESYWGKSKIAQAKNNLFGYGAYDSAPGQDAGLYPSEEYAILFEGWVVRNSYLNPGGSEFVSPTLAGMNVHYATDKQWANSIGSLMGQFAKYVGGGVSSYPQYHQGSSTPAPSSAQEPVYDIQDTGTVMSVPNYGGLPYYSSGATGDKEMFAGTMKEGSSGATVAAVQNYLNQTIHLGLTVDGDYGPKTKQAVMSFEAMRGLPQDGEWNYAMWQMFNPTPRMLAPGTTVSVSKIEMGMVGGFVQEWYYVNGVGWVDSQYVKLNNLYRAMALDPQSSNTTIHVYSANRQSIIATIHSGDFVLSTNPNPQGNMIEVSLSDQNTGQILSGFISTSEANLVPIQ